MARYYSLGRFVDDNIHPKANTSASITVQSPPRLAHSNMLRMGRRSGYYAQHGEEMDAVLGELKISTQQLDRLRDSGVISTGLITVDEIPSRFKYSYSPAEISLTNKNCVLLPRQINCPG